MFLSAIPEGDRRVVVSMGEGGTMPGDAGLGEGMFEDEDEEERVEEKKNLWEVRMVYGSRSRLALCCVWYCDSVWCYNLCCAM